MLKFKHEPRVARFTRGLTPRALILAAAAIALMAVDQHGASLSTLRGALMGVIYPVQWAVNAPSAGLRELSTMFASRNELLEQNERLKHDYLLAQIQLEQLESLRQENQRLRALLNAAGTMRGRVVATTVLSINTNPFANRITINAGANIGLRPGQPLLDARGIIGQTLHVGPLSSQVMLITDPASAVPVQIKRTDTATIAVGTGSLNLLSLPYLPNSTKVKPGDV
ncbi:MAG: rod shape-determining protein MreC, partial [Gammaproteobacteria bacterium]|nr:rod shape-determining protein MreC [Gammaproteobacteria bacterium]